MPRVVHVIGRLNVGGPAAMVLALAASSDLDVSVVAGRVGPDESDYRSLHGGMGEIVDFPSPSRALMLIDDLHSAAWLRSYLIARAPTVVHTHTAKAGVLGRTAALAAGVRYRVHTFHGHLLHGYFSRPVRNAVVATERALARHTTRLVAVGERVRDDLVDAGIGTREQYRVIPPGVALSSVPPSREEARAWLNLSADDKVVACAIRLVAIKRPERLLQMARQLPDTTFLVAGDGPLGPQLRAQASPNLQFLGWRADVATLYAAADVAVLTSDNEGMPLSLVEAALCGIPAVTTNVGSANEVVLDGATGVVVPPHIDALVYAVRRLLVDEPERRRMGAAALARAQVAFSVQKMVQAHVDLYRDILQ